MQQFVWKQHSRMKGDPQLVGKALRKIEREHKTIKPEVVVQEARRKDSPLHECFEWDDARAADAYRIDQARAVIRNIWVVTESDGEPQPVYCNVVVDRATVNNELVTERHYFSMDRVLSDDGLTAALLQTAIAELRAFERRYSRFEALTIPVAAARETIAALDAQNKAVAV